MLGQGYYTIEKLEFTTRLDGISWWTNSVHSRGMYGPGSPAPRGLAGTLVRRSTHAQGLRPVALLD